MYEDLAHFKENEAALKKLRTMRYISLSAGAILTAAFVAVAVLGWQKMDRERLDKYAACRDQMYLYSRKWLMMLEKTGS